mmetsp:Transcript_22514/g.60910  ORF Transcript_22514/g.60910 Transcript_22514/m.60910 type:complete len:353 (+) Transcript_22514:453-1511(+)
MPGMVDHIAQRLLAAKVGGESGKPHNRHLDPALHRPLRARGQGLDVGEEGEHVGRHLHRRRDSPARARRPGPCDAHVEQGSSPCPHVLLLAKLNRLVARLRGGGEVVVHAEERHAAVALGAEAREQGDGRLPAARLEEHVNEEVAHAEGVARIVPQQRLREHDGLLHRLLLLRLPQRVCEAVGVPAPEAARAAPAAEDARALRRRLGRFHAHWLVRKLEAFGFQLERRARRRWCGTRRRLRLGEEAHGVAPGVRVPGECAREAPVELRAADKPCHAHAPAQQGRTQLTELRAVEGDGCRDGLRRRGPVHPHRGDVGGEGARGAVAVGESGGGEAREARALARLPHSVAEAAP